MKNETVEKQKVLLLPNDKNLTLSETKKQLIETLPKFLKVTVTDEQGAIVTQSISQLKVNRNTGMLTYNVTTKGTAGMSNIQFNANGYVNGSKEF